MAWKKLFGSFFTGVYVSPIFLGMKRFIFFDQSIPIVHVLEVDLVARDPNGPVVVGVTHRDEDGKRIKVHSATVPRESRELLYKTLDDFGYPVKEFYSPRRKTETRRRLEDLLQTRSSLRDIDPREIHQ